MNLADYDLFKFGEAEVLAVRTVAMDVGYIVGRAGLEADFIEALKLPDTVAKVIITMLADTPSAVKLDIASSAASAESVPTKPHTNPESLDGPLLREAEAMPAADPVLSPTDKHAGRDPRRSRPPKEETVESTLGRFDLRLIETRTGWAAIHGVKVIGHYSLKAEATHCALNHALFQLRQGSFL